VQPTITAVEPVRCRSRQCDLTARVLLISRIQHRRGIGPYGRDALEQREKRKQNRLHASTIDSINVHRIIPGLGIASPEPDQLKQGPSQLALGSAESHTHHTPKHLRSHDFLVRITVSSHRIGLLHEAFGKPKPSQLPSAARLVSIISILQLFS
jgi:hypothetical protein